MAPRHLLLVLAIVTLAIATATWEATTSNLTVLAIAEDMFYNYDFASQSVSSSNVDWPVCLVFYGNADVNKVKGIYWGATILANPMYAYLNDGAGWVWDPDRGTKGVVYSSYLGGYVYLHMRVYAPNPPDYMSNTYWGRYVVATAHYDQFPLESWSGYTEYAERHLASIASAKGYATFVDWAYFYNPEPYRAEGSHIWLNDGYATAVYVP
ncbi:hypothetical protein [Infirmifilum sp. NZ]|uniref:hypothetical protein n=1 Tax=Infirmifilum sp. NZ TaxID=2926850 RepID=UPI00279DBC4F|nr:hypothetical protein [Infirmifilum sp. NZ]UNQ73808.1 hypothetical protein MOV14_02045 [Infirmifilum sp. NZ]